MSTRIARDMQWLVDENDDLIGYRKNDSTQVLIGTDARAEGAAAVVGVAGIPIARADLATTTGKSDTLYEVSDGDNRGAKIVWAVPEGASVATWCWWLWPQSAFEI